MRIRVPPKMEKETTCQTSALSAANTTIKVRAATDPTAPAPWEIALTGSLNILPYTHMRAYLAISLQAFNKINFYLHFFYQKNTNLTEFI